MANVRVHGETQRQPIDLFAEEKARLRPLPAVPYDGAVVRPISANGCCYVVLDTNRYSVPHLYASQKLTLKLYPDQLLLFHHEKLIAAHARSYDRRQKIRQPDHLKELETQRNKARDQTCLLAFLALSPHAEAYARTYGLPVVVVRPFNAYGPRLERPEVGALAVLGSRRGWASHVGVVSSVDADGTIHLISGNWGRRVAEAVVSRGSVIGFVAVR